MDRLLHGAEAFLLRAIVIVGNLKSRLFPASTKAWKSGLSRRPRWTFNGPLVPRQPASPPCECLHAFEIGQHVCIGPARRAAFRPMVEIMRMAAHIDHAVDRGGSADDLAAWRDQRRPPRCGSGSEHKAPIIGAHVHREGQGRRHLDEGANICAAKFNDDHGVLAVLRQAVSHGGTGRP